MPTAPITIIGTGLAGYNLAKEIRKLDNEVPLRLITQDDGCFYSKPQLSSSFAHNKLPDDLPMADVNKMRAQLNAEILTYADVTAVNPDQKTLSLGDHHLPYSQCVFANGAAVLPVTFEGNAQADLIRVNNLEDYRRFNTVLSGKKTIAIIGAGLVGTEFSVDLSTAGFDVQVIAMSKTPLDTFMPAECGQVVQAALAKEKGVQWHLDDTIQSIHKTNYGFDILCKDKTVTVDVVLVAIGIRPDTQLAKAAGLAVNKGIVVDEYCQTSHADVFALGDCAEINGVVRNYTAPILHSARALAKTITGTPTPVTFPIMPIVVKSPAHPVVMVQPNDPNNGQWTVEAAEADGSKALFYNNNRLTGFILTGKFAKERQDYLQRIH